MDNRSAYEAMSDQQLQDLAVNYRIPPARRVDEQGEHYYFDREQMIEALLNYDALRFGPPPQSILPAEKPGPAFRLKARQCDPQLWQNFSYEKTSKTSKFRESLIYEFVSLSIPGHRTNRDVVEQVAKESHIPIESLADDLHWPVFSRGQAIFGFAGDEFDKIAENYEGMEWWVSDAGLNMAIVTAPNGLHLRLPTFDELLGGQIGERDEAPVVENSAAASETKELLDIPDASAQVLKRGKRRGRRANPERREAIRDAINKHGNQWRDHLLEILSDLDAQAVPLGDFQGTKIDVGDGAIVTVAKWEELDLALGEERSKILDALRKYF